MKIPENILKILAECRIEGNTLFLPPEQLDRATYTKVNKCLEDIGGKWNRKAKGHVFDDDPAEAFENLILTGETEDMKKTFQFFPTPRNIAELMCDMAELEDGQWILEPSCGKGDLADVIYERAPQHLYCVELNEGMKKYLDGKPYKTTYADFLHLHSDTELPYDRIVMNPPFSRQQDIDHILHAFDLLKDGGILVSVVSVSPFFRTNKKAVDFRAWLEDCDAEIVDVDKGAFRESGTEVPTKIIKVRKGE